MRPAHTWTIEMLGCGHVYTVKTVPGSIHQDQQVHCQECDELGYWRFR